MSAPDNTAVTDDSYVNRPGQDSSNVPVQSDSAAVEDGVNPDTENSDEQLAKDDTDAIDESNIIEDKTRGAGPEGGYAEPGDEEGLPEDDGTSAVAQ